MTARPFDAYLIVDWSAASIPKRGADCIWYCLRGRNGRVVLENPPARRQATDGIRAHLGRLVRERCSVLVGFDFPFGYPRGFAARLGLLGGPAPWRAIWDYLAGAIRDDERNGNNRFEVAAEQDMQRQSVPILGVPAGPRNGLPLTPKGRLARRRAHPVRTPADRTAPSRRAAGLEAVHHGRAGSQALLGIPRGASPRPRTCAQVPRLAV